MRVLGRVLVGAVTAELLLVLLGRASGSTRVERAASLPGDRIVRRPTAVTDHAITIDAPPEAVWPWLVQMGWHRGGWYTARWVDRLLFPDNWPSTTRIIPELQERRVGDFIPDGAPETGCGLYVEVLEPERALVLHSNSHLPKSWRDRDLAALDWWWAFVLSPVDDGTRTRFHFRSRWVDAAVVADAGWLAVGRAGRPRDGARPAARRPDARGEDHTQGSFGSSHEPRPGRGSTVTTEEV